ncbi:MAG: TRAP transporter small permease [Sphaerochaetaceae bacterium]|nr:TRAP transporter small permease [Sphaerochaetaceae bacterium]MDC7249565.1 TRAP transporter small permease [Sphaerochaetaceae bacterium]
MNKLDSFIEKVINAVQNVCSALLMIMLAIVFASVFARYLFNSPIIWSEEITLMLLIWFGFFSISNELYFENHMSLTIAYNKFSPKKKKIISVSNAILFIIFFSLMAVNIVRISLVISTTKMPVSGIPKVLLYLPVLISAILMVIYSVALLYKKIHQDYSIENSEPDFSIEKEI